MLSRNNNVKIKDNNRYEIQTQALSYQRYAQNYLKVMTISLLPKLNTFFFVPKYVQCSETQAKSDKFIVNDKHPTTTPPPLLPSSPYGYCRTLQFLVQILRRFFFSLFLKNIFDQNNLFSQLEINSSKWIKSSENIKNHKKSRL